MGFTATSPTQQQVPNSGSLSVRQLATAYLCTAEVFLPTWGQYLSALPGALTEEEQRDGSAVDQQHQQQQQLVTHLLWWPPPNSINLWSSLQTAWWMAANDTFFLSWHCTVAQNSLHTVWDNFIGTVFTFPLSSALCKKQLKVTAAVNWLQMTSPYIGLNQWPYWANRQLTFPPLMSSYSFLWFSALLWLGAKIYQLIKCFILNTTQSDSERGLLI